jgi:Na+-driven multidrug efflux pump
MLSAQLLDIVIWSILFMGISSVFGGYLTSLQDRKSLILSFLTICIVGIFMVPILIKFFGAYGGAISSLFNEFIIVIVLIIFTLRREKNKEINNRINIKISVLNITKVLLISILMAFIVRFLSVVLHFNLLICIITGIFIYFVLSIIFGTLSNKDLVEIKGMIGRKNINI